MSPARVKPAPIDQQIQAFRQAFRPVDAKILATLAGYRNVKQFGDYRARGRAMNDARLEKLAQTLERLAVIARAIKSTPTETTK